MDIAAILDKIRPGAAWRRSDDYETLVATWEDTVQTIPTREEIEAAWPAVKARLDRMDLERSPQAVKARTDLLESLREKRRRGESLTDAERDQVIDAYLGLDVRPV